MLGVTFSALPCPATHAADWGINEIQFQYGNLATPIFAGGGDAETIVLTFQHASAWKYGTNFLFIDFLSDDKEDGFNDEDFYGEWYPTLSIPKILGQEDFRFGLITDMRIIAGINYGVDPKVRKYLPGIELSWQLPGFAFLNTDFTAYLDDNEGISAGGAPKEDASFMIDVNWAYPFSMGRAKFSIEGHIEYIGTRANELGGETTWWILGQPQIRCDIGDLLFNVPQHLYMGTEIQFWINKLGDPHTDEFVPQALLVWRI